MMNILFCVHQYHPARGGAETLMKGVTERLASRGHAVRVLATTAVSTEAYFLRGQGKNLLPAETETINGVSVTRVPFRRFGAPLLNKLRAIAWRIPIPFKDFWRMLSWGPRSRVYYRNILAAKKVDILAAGPLPTLGIWYAWRAARRRSLPIVIIPCFHTEDRYTFHNRRYFRWLREAEAVICLTEWERTYLNEVAGVDLERLHTIGVGIEREENESGGGKENFMEYRIENGEIRNQKIKAGGNVVEKCAESQEEQRSRIEAGEGRDESGMKINDTAKSSQEEYVAARNIIRTKYGLTGAEIVLFLGQHAAHKGIVALIEAMEMIWKREARDVDLIIAGNPTAYTAIIEQKIVELPEAWRGRIRLIKGFDDLEKKRLLRAADVFVSVSPYESFGIVYLETWREKRPVVGCLRGASARLIDPFRDGLLVHADNAAETAGAILDLLNDPELRSRMGERGRTKTRERFDWDAIVDHWEKLFRNIVRPGDGC